MLNTPLTDEEIIELDEFLLEGSDEDDRLTVDEAHGFITSLVVGHEAAAEDEWMEAVWGRPEFADDAERQRLTALLRRLHQDVVATLESGAPFEPLLAEVEEDGETFVACDGWCFGFMLGVSGDEERWGKLPPDEQDLLTPIANLALLHVDDAPEMDEEDCETLAELLPGSVRGLYLYWAAQATHN
jgi:uncharacterized protein